MTDIVDRLRGRHANDFGWAETEALMREAADEIERLRHECGEWVLKNAALQKEIARLRHECGEQYKEIVELRQQIVPWRTIRIAG